MSVSGILQDLFERAVFSSGAEKKFHGFIHRLAGGFGGRATTGYIKRHRVTHELIILLPDLHRVSEFHRSESSLARAERQCL